LSGEKISEILPEKTMRHTKKEKEKQKEKEKSEQGRE
jgi:hypothetical protein